jgi:superfamily II DNA or RNA helicase
MADIVLKSKNHVHCVVEGSDVGILQEINDFFTFEMPNARFMPTYRAKLWDGKVRLFNLFSRELYVGLIPYVRQFAAQNNYTIEDQRQQLPQPYFDVSVFVEELNLHARGEPLETRDYQLDAIKHAVYEHRSLLLSPTGSGKSMILYTLMRYHLQNNRKILIIVPTTSLVEQLYSDFQDYSSANGFKVSNHVHRVYAGKDRDADYPVILSTWQSLYKLPKNYFEKFDAVFGDEAHGFKANSLQGILNKMPNCAYRTGTTGTLDGLKTHKLVLEGIFGAVYKVTTTKQLIKSKTLTDLKIQCLTLSYPEATRKLAKDLNYQQEMDWLVTHPPRNRFIRNLALAQEGNTLVLFQFVEKHGIPLHEMIQAKAAEGRKIFLVHSGTETADREAIRAITEKEDNAIIVASYGTFSTGINIRRLHNIIFASPSKSRIRNLQSIGRGLRTSDDKRQCNLFDIGDDLSYKSHRNFTLLHLAERIRIYNEEHFDYKLIKVNIE